jgi:hypothetical protein
VDAYVEVLGDDMIVSETEIDQTLIEGYVGDIDSITLKIRGLNNANRYMRARFWGETTNVYSSEVLINVSDGVTQEFTFLFPSPITLDGNQTKSFFQIVNGPTGGSGTWQYYGNSINQYGHATYGVYHLIGGGTMNLSTGSAYDWYFKLNGSVELPSPPIQPAFVPIYTTEFVDSVVCETAGTSTTCNYVYSTTTKELTKYEDFMLFIGWMFLAMGWFFGLLFVGFRFIGIKD